MLIESLIRRTGGSHIEIGGVDYHFKPAGATAEAPHVCEVEDEDAIAVFLAIKEGYRIARAVAKPASTPSPAPSLDAAPNMIIKRGDEQADLGPMTRNQLLAFADENKFEVTSAMKLMKVDDLRAAIFTLATTEA